MTIDSVVALGLVVGAVVFLVWRAVKSRRKAKDGCDKCGH